MNVVAAAARQVAPGDDEAPILQSGDARGVGCRRAGTDAERFADAAAVVVVALCINVDVATAPVALPDHHEAPVRQTGHGRPQLIPARRGIDPELGADGLPRGVVALAVDAGPLPILTVGIPGHHEAAIGQGGDGRLRLSLCRVGIDPEFAAHQVAADVVALAVDARVTAVLAPGRPGGDQAAVLQCGEGGGVLVAGGEAVDAKFAPQGVPGGIEAAGEHSRTIAIGALPTDDEASVRQPGDGRGVLRAGGDHIHLKLAAGGGARTIGRAARTAAPCS
jgi:hypothetical protein